MNDAPTCSRCHTPMQPGKAIAETYRGGIPDFPSDEHASTFYAGGPGRLIDCLKCPSCGHSVTENKR